MTFIQPPKNESFINKVIAILVLGLVLGAFWLIVLYNNFVTLSRNISDMKTKISDLEAQNAETKDRIFSMFGTQNLQKLASERGLVQDKNPQYLEANQPQQWSFASHF